MPAQRRLSCCAVFFWVAHHLLAVEAAATTAVVTVQITSAAPVNASRLPVGWTWSLLSQSTNITTPTCPAGSYCPAGNTGAVPCARGTFASTGSRAVACTDACPANSFCPAGAASPTPCPANTASTVNAWSIYNCTCNTGYACVYTALTRLTVRVPVSVQTWLANPALQAALVNAIAAAAGVDPSKVTVKGRAPVLGGRRLLGLLAGKDKMTELSVSIEGAVNEVRDTGALVDAVLVRARSLSGPLQFLSLSSARTEPRVMASRLAVI